MAARAEASVTGNPLWFRKKARPSADVGLHTHSGAESPRGLGSYKAGKQGRLLTRLRSGGWLVLGVRERLPAQAAGLIAISQRLGLYRNARI